MKEYSVKNVFLGRLQKGDDLLKEITAFVKEKNIETGFINVIGAATKAVFGYYDMQSEEYEFITREGEFEILNVSGNVSIKDGEPMVHAHILFADNEGNTFGGHLAEGTKVFAAELYIQELEGKAPVRKFDKETGLTLW